MLPRHRASDAPPPLVIQADYAPDVFRPDGPVSSAYAAQPLVAKGFAVLQVVSKQLTVTAAAAEYGISRRHLHRLLVDVRLQFCSIAALCTSVLLLRPSLKSPSPKMVGAANVS